MCFLFNTHTCSNWVYEQTCAKVPNVIAEAVRVTFFLKLSVCWYISSKCPVLNIIINVYEWKFKEGYMRYECRENI